MFHVEWIQHAVGHGGFHTGHMWDDSKQFNWIFDCGARRTRRFNDYLRSWLDDHEVPIDWLFISHFDTDHVSGLNELMGRSVVKEVMVPYVNDHELAYVLLHEIDRDNLNYSFVELVADPASFFLSRGADRVTFLGRGDGDEELSAEIPPDDGPKDATWKTRILPPPRQLKGRIGIGRKATDQASVLIVDNTYCDISIERGSHGLRLKPYRLPIEKRTHLNLLKDLKKLMKAGTLRSSRPGLGDLSYAIALHARTRHGRANLRILFKDHVGSSNRSSLSLLSIPQCSEPANTDWWVSSRSANGHGNGTPAWLTTGDAELLDPADLASWQKAYATDLDHVRILALPHHGSDKNSDKSLQDLCSKAFFVAHAKSSARKHPGLIVSRSAGHRLVSVTENLATRMCMGFHLID